MVKKLSVYIMLILVFLIPFSVSMESVLNKTQAFSFSAFASAINRGFWYLILFQNVLFFIKFFKRVMFGELLDILDEFNGFFYLKIKKKFNFFTYKILTV